ncbi:MULTISPECIES: DUF6176 family protein [unclassified Haladaptatus]|uniref:DUF6176 family protein n=1 Tax=unclassified Haladaptatus TaxID=2622732 RepID=UPI0023E7837D|nr:MULTISPECIES: DUF6176 family protein [unclassified Haladaptatus]
MVDVLLVNQRIADGNVDRAKALLSQLDDPETLDAALAILDAEGVHTESAFLRHDDEGPFVTYYIEAEDGATVYDVFKHVTENPEAQPDEMAAFIEEFNAVMDGDPYLVESEVLYHLVNPERPEKVN